VYRLRVFFVIPVLQVVRKLTTRSGLAGHGQIMTHPLYRPSGNRRRSLSAAKLQLLQPFDDH
jgi:hypothetical protein